jgi:predicted ester cyclase
MGLAPTGKQVAISGMAVLHIGGGKVEELHEVFDQLSLMQQIGAIPSS